MRRIVTMATPNLMPHCKELLANQKEYASAMGYEHICYEEKHPDFMGFHPVYSRLGYMLDAFRDGADRVVWADIDVAFMNYGWNVGELIDQIEGTIVARWGNNQPEQYHADGYWMAGYQQTNWPGAYLCFGLVVLRNNWVSKAFLQEVATIMRENPEQSAREQYYVQVALIKMNFAGVRLCTGKEIGCFSSQLWHDGTIWEPDMPTVHFAGPSDWATRQKTFIKHYLPLVKK